MSEFGRWLVILLLSLAILFSGLVLTSYILDPFGVFHRDYPEWLGINRKKTAETGGYSRIVRPYRYRFYEPDMVLFGSSRTEIGLDPRSKYIKHMNPYNFAQGMMEWEENLQLLKHVHKTRPNAFLFIGLDFAMMNSEISVNAVYNPHRLLPFWQGLYKSGDILPLLFSKDVMERNIKLMTDDTSKKCAYSRCLFARGHSMTTAWAKSIKKLRKELHNYRAQIRYASELFVFDESNPKYNAFMEAMELLYLWDHKVAFIISPSHAEQVEAIRASKTYEIYENWKRLVVRTVEELAKKHGKPPIPIFDFQGYNSVTTKIPGKNRPDENGYYLESSHYTPKTGDLVLRRVFGKDLDEVPDDFGVLITSKNIESHLQDQRQRQSLYHDKLRRLKIKILY